MNYASIYERLMRKGTGREPLGYFETHHILPKCLGGGDEETNLVRLTPEEHYVAHQLLVKIYPKHHGLLWAAFAMTGTGHGKGNGRRGNKLYGWLRRRFNRSQTGRKLSEDTKRKIGLRSKIQCQGQSHPMYGRKHSAESKLKMSAAQRARRGTLSEETRLKMSASQRARKLTPEQVEKKAALCRARNKDPSMRAKVSASAKQRSRNAAGIFT